MHKLIKYQDGATLTGTPAFQQSNVKQELIPQQFVQKTKLDTRPFIESTATVFREPRKFKNIVEKQQYWNSLVNKYGSGVKNREGYIDFYDYKLPGIEYEGSRNFLYGISPSSIKYLNPDLAKLATNYYSMSETLTSPNKLNRYVLNRAKQRGITLTTQNQIDEATEAAKTELKSAMYKLNEQFNAEPSNQYNVNSKPTTWRNLLENRNDISDKALLFSSLMDEGGDQFTNRSRKMYNHNTISGLNGFTSFGLDTFGQRINEFTDKGYVPKELKDKISFIEQGNEKGETVTSAYFYSYDDLITAKEAFIKQGRAVVNEEAAKLNINLSKEALDYFTIITYNYGEAGAKKMMKEYKDAGILDNNKFMQDNSYPSYRQIHNNAKRRLQTKNMLIGEGIIKQDPQTRNIKLGSMKKGGIIKYQKGAKTYYTDEEIAKMNNQSQKRNIHTNKPIITPYQEWVKQNAYQSPVAKQIKESSQRQREQSEVYAEPNGKVTVYSKGIQPTASPIDFAVGGIGALYGGGLKLAGTQLDLVNPIPMPNVSKLIRKIDDHLPAAVDKAMKPRYKINLTPDGFYEGQFLNQKEYLSEGLENLVYKSNDNKNVFKLRHVMQPTKDISNIKLRSRLLEELSGQRTPTVGYFKIEGVKPSMPIIQQPYIPHHGGPITEQEIQNFATKHKMQKLNNWKHPSYKYKNYVLDDLHEENFVRDKDGNIRLIDLFAKKLKEYRPPIDHDEF